MSSELAVIKLFCTDRTLFDTYYSYTQSLKNLERELKLILRLVADFYKKYDALAISQSDLLVFYDVQYPQNKDRSIYRDIITGIFAVEANPDVAGDLLEQIMEKYYASAIVSKLIPVVEGNKFGVLDTLETDVKEYVSKMRNPTTIVNALLPFERTVDELTSLVYPEGGLNWITPTLTRTIGPIMKGSLGTIFAYVDSGKTSFGIANFVQFAQQLKETSENIVYAGNEESASRLAFRMTQAMLKKTRQEIMSDTHGASTTRLESGWSRIKLFDNITTTSQVTHILEEYQPTLLFIDQGTKIHLDGGRAFTDSSEVSQLQYLFNFYREAAKEYEVAIVILAQAVGEAENKRWLKLSDMYGSRVSIQGELDYAIGIGRIVDDPTKEDLRFMHVCKNKLLDGASCKFTTYFVKEKCEWREV
jgi:hypothetical protein